MVSKDFMEEQLRKLSRAVEQSPCSIVVTDTTGAIEYVNPKFTQVTGYSFQEAVGQNPRLLKSGHMQEENYKCMWEAIKAGREWRGEFHNKKKNGECYWEMASISPVKNPEGVVTHFVAVKEDITARKMAEEELHRAKEEAETATRLKDKFVSLVAHDLQNPFSSIVGYLKLILGDQSHPLHSEHRDVIERVLGIGEGLQAMIKELLEVSRLKSGKILPRLRFCDAHFTVQQVVYNMEFIAKRKGVKLINLIPPNTRFYMDLEMFSQVIVNLVSNAIKFCKKDGEITLFLPAGETSTLAVKDTGVGIPENRRQLLFQYEEKTSTLGTEGEKGTGFGLPLCHDIMTAHGGTLDFESTPGQGTVFYARLPFLRPLVQLVDDDPLMLLLVREVLRPLDVDFLEAANGAEALTQIGQKTPHLIISDLQMPVMDGFKLLENIRQNPLLREIPIIVLTSNDTKETRNRAFGLQADDFLTKPITQEELVFRVKRQINRVFL